MGYRTRQAKARTGWLVKAILIAIPLAIIYLGFTFVPPYLRYMKARSILNNTGSKTYTLRSEQHRWYEVVEDIRRDLRKELLKELGLGENDLELDMKKIDHHIRIKAEWVDRARYPFVGKSTRLKFTYQVKARTK